MIKNANTVCHTNDGISEPANKNSNTVPWLHHLSRNACAPCGRIPAAAFNHKNSGIITLVLNVALSAAIGQMIFSDAHFTYMGWTVFAYAAYAFYKITMSIVALIKAHRQDDLTVRAIRNINLVDALVSILALQTALLTTFGDGTMNISAMNTLTGIVVSTTAIAIGIYMIVSANKKMKELQKENNSHEQSI